MGFSLVPVTPPTVDVSKRFLNPLSSSFGIAGRDNVSCCRGAPVADGRGMPAEDWPLTITGAHNSAMAQRVDMLRNKCTCGTDKGLPGVCGVQERSSCENRSKDTSSKRFAMTCSPKGIPLLCVKSGREIAGHPTRLAITV